jgi:ribosomal protein L37AE/L43A
MKVVSLLVGPVIRCAYCGQRGAVLHFDRVEAQSIWRCRCCRHARNGKLY